MPDANLSSQGPCWGKPPRTWQTSPGLFTPSSSLTLDHQHRGQGDGAIACPLLSLLPGLDLSLQYHDSWSRPLLNTPLAISLTQSPSAFSIFICFSICWGCCSSSGTRFDPLFATSAKLFPLVGQGFHNLLLCRAGPGSPTSLRELAELLLPDISCTVPLTIAQIRRQISEVLGDGQTLSRLLSHKISELF